MNAPLNAPLNAHLNAPLSANSMNDTMNGDELIGHSSMNVELSFETVGIVSAGFIASSSMKRR